MKQVLVDTSVWFSHFRRRNDTLATLLRLDLVLTHPLIWGEIACGAAPSRHQILRDLWRLRQAQRASVREVVAFVESEHLYGQGCGLSDLMVLTSALMTPGVKLWTLDRRLAALAYRYGAAHRPDWA
ncbi:type II toxin-antitoxin system VapC family toxin [Oxalobacteraceae bacterium A2-2]